MSSTKRTKIVLFNPLSAMNSEFVGLPLALLAISKYLAANKYEIKVISALKGNNYKKTILDEMKESLCLGITAMTSYQIHDALYVCKAIKNKYPKKKIIWGGWHSSILPKQTLGNKFVDIVCIGQGERTFPEVIKAIEGKKSLAEIEGIGYKIKNRQIFTKSRKVADINSFPDIPFKLVDIESHISATKIGKRTINYISSYGCPFNCGFCAESVVNKRMWSGLDAKRVVKDIKVLYQKHGIDSIIFNDSNFFVSEERTREICQGLLSKKIKIRWGHANGTASVMNKFKKSTFKLMSQSGCCSILIGAKSGLNGILRYINKSGNVQDIIKFTKTCGKFGIKIIPSFIIGFPKSKTNKSITIADEFWSTLNLIKQMMKITKNMEILWFNYTPYPGTSLYCQSLKLGLKEPENLENWSKFELTNFSNVNWMPPKYSSRIELLMKFIFPVVLDNNNSADSVLREDFMFRLTAPFVRLIANLRLKLNFYDFPVEYTLLKKIYKFMKKSK